MSITQAHGWSARFKTAHSFHDRPVVLWQSEGSECPVGWILEQESGKFRPADSFQNFDGYLESTDTGTTFPAPAGWWAVERLDDHPEQAWWSPIIAWHAVGSSGWDVRACIADPDAPLLEAGEKVRFVYDPERHTKGLPRLTGEWPRYLLEQD